MQITITVEADTLEEALVKLRAPAPKGTVYCDNFIDQTTVDKHAPYLALGLVEEPTDQELTDALTAVLQRHGKEAAMQLLADFDTTSVKRLPAGRAREFLAAAEKALAS